MADTTGTAYVTHIGLLIILDDQIYHGGVVTMVFVLYFYIVVCVQTVQHRTYGSSSWNSIVENEGVGSEAS